MTFIPKLDLLFISLICQDKALNSRAFALSVENY